MSTWIQSELKRLHPDRYRHDGFDVDGDGHLSADEQIATYNKNTIPGNDPKVIGDWADWLAFYRAHAHKLAQLGGIFAESARFKPTSPFHLATTIESTLVTRETILTAYQRMTKIHEIFDQKLQNPPAVSLLQKKIIEKTLKRYPPSSEPRVLSLDIGGMTFRAIVPNRRSITSIIKRMIALHTTLKELNYERKGFSKELLVVFQLHLRKITCFPSTLIAMTLGHEHGWPIYPVPAYKHIFPRWDGPINEAHHALLNIEILNKGVLFPLNAYYKRSRNLSSEILERTAYLETHDTKLIVSAALMHRGIFKFTYGKRSDMLDALKDFDQAIRLTPKEVEPYINKGFAYAKLNKWKLALRCFKKALSINERAAKAYLGKALVNARLKRIARARRMGQLANHYGSKVTWLKKKLPVMKAYPHFYSEAQVRISNKTDGTSVDGRISLGLRWNLAQLYKNLGLGLQIATGVGMGGEHVTIDLTGGLSLVGEWEQSSLAFEAGLGYNFLATGDSETTPLKKGGLVTFCLRYHYEIRNHFGIGLNLLLQYGMGGGEIVILPGAQLTYDF